jgi:hypothetical protein
LSEHAGGDPAIGLLAALARTELAADHSAVATLRTAIQRLPSKGRLPEILEERVADWIANDVNPYPAGPASTDEAKDLRDPDAHADAVIRALESRCEALGVDRSLLPAAALRVASIAAVRGSEQRKAGRLDDARRTVACLSAIARKLERRNPAEPEYHVILSEAFSQESKNAWRVEDYPAIEETLRRALGEARTALRLDPQNVPARIKVASLQDKLVGLSSEQPSTR